MNRLIITLFAVWACVSSAQAYDVWYDEPITIGAGETVLCDTALTLTAATVHVRMAMPNDKEGSWSLLWCYQNTDNYCRATLTLPAYDKYDYYSTPAPRLRVESVVNGTVNTIYDGAASNLSPNGDFNSLRLVYDGGDKARLTGGTSESVAYCIVPFSADTPTMAVQCSRPAKCQRLTVDLRGETQVPQSRYANVDALIEHTNTSDDANEGVWEYMDRRLDKDKAELGGRYRIATVRQGDNYDIVYLDGADINPRFWHPLMLKGRLTPTIFIGDYDLQWYDAHGRLITGDANCRITDDHATLTVTIPEIGAQLRFRKCMPNVP